MHRVRRRGSGVLATFVAALVLLGIGAASPADPGADPGGEVTTTTVPTTTTPATTVAPATTAVPPPTTELTATTVAPAPPTTVPAPTTTPRSPTGRGGREGGSGGYDGYLVMTLSHSTIRLGYPMTFSVTWVDPPPGITFPVIIEFYTAGFPATVYPMTLQPDYTAELTVPAPAGSVMSAQIFQPPAMSGVITVSQAFNLISGYGSSVTVSTSPPNPVPGRPVLVQTQVSPVTKSGRTEGGPPMPTGQVQVLSGSTVLGQGTLNGSGQANVSVTTPPAGESFVVNYSGDALYDPSSSASVVVPPGPTTTTTTTTTTEPPAPPTTVPTEVAVAPLVTEDEVVADETTTTTTAPEATDEDEDTEDTPADDGDDAGEEGDSGETAAADTGSSSSGTAAERTTFIRSVPTREDIDWGVGHVATNLALALFLLILVAIPATLVDATIEENYQRIFAVHPRLEAIMLRAEAGMTALPSGVLLLGLAVVGALIFGQLEFDLGWNATSFVLLSALALVIAIVVALHDLARLPFLERKVDGGAGRLGVYPFALVLAVVLVVVSKVVGFQPGFVFGVIGGLALSDAVEERDDGLTLAGAAAAMLGVAFAAWWLWTPVAERVVQPDPGLWTLFLDAFLATLWLTCLQAVVFGLAPVRFLDGDLIRRWNGWAWLGLWALSVFVLVQCFLHPSAGRWGGLDTNSMWSAIAVFVVFLVAGVAFWAWFRFRPAPAAMADDPEDAVTS